MLTAGVGVCRHLTALLVTVLRENGFSTANYKIGPVSPLMDHAWVEVRIRDPKSGQEKVFAADPSEPQFLKSLEDLTDYATKNPLENVDYSFYTNPNRYTYDP